MMVIWYEDKSKYADKQIPCDEEARYLLSAFCNEQSIDRHISYTQAIIHLIVEYYKQKGETDKLANIMKARFSDEWIEKLTGERV